MGDGMVWTADRDGRPELGSKFVVERDGLGEKLFTEAGRVSPTFGIAKIPFELQAA